MSRAAPPENGSGRLGLNSDRTRRFKGLVRPGEYCEPALSASKYVSLLAARYAEDLLTPFRCHSCGQQSLDPLGWNGRRMPLCTHCADGGELCAEMGTSA